MGDDRARHKGGEYKETVSEDDALSVLRRAQKPFVTATDVADELDCSRATALRKLAKIDDKNGDGTIRRTDVGANAVVWWIPDDEPDNETDDELN